MKTFCTPSRLSRCGLALLVVLSPALGSAQTFVGVIYPTRDLTLSVSVSGVVSNTRLAAFTDDGYNSLSFTSVSGEDFKIGSRDEPNCP